MKKESKRKTKKLRSETTKPQLQKHRVANEKAVEKHRTNKKNKTTTSIPIKIFKTPQLLGKAKSRVKKTSAIVPKA